MSQRSYFVTGAMGCIGAWTLYHLVRRGERVVSYDISANRGRLDLLLTEAEQAGVTFVRGDLTRREQVQEAMQRYGASHVIHLAALQVPFCRANPVLGAQVNVVGTLNVFEAAREAGIRHVVYASSIAVYGPPQIYPDGLIAHDAPLSPDTLYGGFKQCNEQNARVYFTDYGVGSTALRPYVVYGVGRDQGMTSDPTKAMLAAAAGEDYHIGFGGVSQLQFASDVAQQFIEAADHPLQGAHVFNLGGEPVDMQVVAEAIRAAAPGVNITFEPKALPFPMGFDDAQLRQHMGRVYETPLSDGIQQTVEWFRMCLAEGRLRYPV